MVSTRQLTKKDMIDMIEENFNDVYENKIIATFFQCCDIRSKEVVQ